MPLGGLWRVSSSPTAFAIMHIMQELLLLTSPVVTASAILLLPTTPHFTCRHLPLLPSYSLCSPTVAAFAILLPACHPFAIMQELLLASLVVTFRFCFCHRAASCLLLTPHLHLTCCHHHHLPILLFSSMVDGRWSPFAIWQGACEFVAS
eukprot:scaffold22506_cov36-Tisochrysis_lutea.AAC.1